MESSTTTPGPEQAEPGLEYRSVEPWAIGGLLASLTVPLLLVDHVLWFLAPLAALINLLALRRVASDPQRTGRTMALLGLALSISIGTYSISQRFTARWIIADQTREIADQFFEFLREGSVEKAQTLRIPPDYRQPFDDQLWTYYRTDAPARKLLEEFVELPMVRTLLVLGKRAEIKFFKMAGATSASDRGIVADIYTVTFVDKDGKKKTFFVKVFLERNPTRQPGLNPWKVKDVVGDVDPREA